MSALLPAWLSALLSAFDLAAPWALLAWQRGSAQLVVALAAPPAPLQVLLRLKKRPLST